MNILFVGGTGTISTAISRRVIAEGHHLYLLNRGHRNTLFDHDNVTQLMCDIHDEQAMARAVEGLTFDAVADFIAFETADVERDYRVFAGKTRQYIFISSASAYQKPPTSYLIDEQTPLENPYWQYSRNKQACEELLATIGTKAFPYTIVRPSHTYDERSVPLGVHGRNGSWQVVARMLQGKPVIIHGDGSSLWTMTHNSDFAQAFCGLLGNERAVGETFQITSDETLSWNQIYEAVADALGVKLNAVHVSSDFLVACSDLDFEGSLLGDKANSVVFDLSKIRQFVPSYAPKRRFAEAIRETIAYVLAHEECQVADPEFDQWCDAVVEARQKAIDEVKKQLM